MVKKVKKVKQKQRQSQKQIVNINLGKPTKRGKRKTQIRQPINYQLTPPPIYNIYQSQPSLIPPPVAPTPAAPTPEIRTPSLIPAPIESPRVSLPIRAGLAVGSAVGAGIGSAILSTGSVVLSSIFFPPDAERPAVERPAITPAVVPFPVREEPPAFANIEPVFAEPPFPLVPYQPPLPPPDDEFFDLPEDPFNIEQPLENPFLAPEVAAPAEEAKEENLILEETKEEPQLFTNEPSFFDLPTVNLSQYESLRDVGTPKYVIRPSSSYQSKEERLRLAEERRAQQREKNLFGLEDVNVSIAPVAPIIEPVIAAKPQKKKVATKPSTDDKPELTVAQIRAKLRREEEAAAKKEAKRREQGKDVRGLFPVEAQPVIIGQALFEEPQKEELPFGLEVIQRATPEKQKGGLERVRTEPEEPLQYGFSN
jgi:hypothetical protein